MYDYAGTFDTIAPFVENEWKPVSGLTVETGLRYQSIQRGFNAQVVPNSRPATGGEIDRTVHAVLPSLETNYAVTGATHVCTQLAKSALVPSQAFFYTNKPVLGNQVQPQTSRSLQTGVIYAAGPISLTAAAYLTDLKNYVSTTTDPNKNTIYVNSGRVRHRGLEAEANVDVTHGWTIVGNGSVMRAQFRDPGLVSATQQAGDTIPLTPRYLLPAGALYKNGPWAGSVYGEFVRTQFQGPAGSAEGNDRRVGAYSCTNLTLSRSFDEWMRQRHAVVNLSVNNLFNQTLVTDSAGRSALGASGPLLANVLPSRTFMIAFRCDL